MSERVRAWATTALRLLIAAVLVGVVIIAHRGVGWTNLALMLAALFGLILLLADYNRKYK